MKKLTRSVLKEIIKEVIKENRIREASSSRSTSTIAKKGGRSGETDRAQADYDTHLKKEPSATSTVSDESQWVDPHTGKKHQSKLKAKPDVSWTIVDDRGRVADKQLGTQRDYDTARVKRGYKKTPALKVSYPTSTIKNPEYKKWDTKKTQLGGRLTTTKTSDVRKRTQAIGGMKAARGGMKGGKGDSGRGRSIGRASAKKFAKLSGYKTVKGKGKGKGKGKEDEE